MRRSSLVISLVVGALLVPVAVFASHQFNDVPDSHIFHTGISWMKDNNITVGCNPPANTNYCPNDNVTRGEMATFMKRLAENKVVDAATATNADDADLLDGKDGLAYTNPAAGSVSNNVAMANLAVVKVAELSIEAPDSGGLTIAAQVAANSTTNGTASFWLQADNTTCSFDLEPFYSVAYGFLEQSGGVGSSPSVVGVADVAAGSHTVTFCGRTGLGGPLSVSASLVAQYATSVTRTGTLSSTSGDLTGLVPTS